jgi:hypothetical protein
MQISEELLMPQAFTKFEYLFEDAKRRNEHQIKILSTVKDKECTFKPNRQNTNNYKVQKASSKKEIMYARLSDLTLLLMKRLGRNSFIQRLVGHLR